jgi:hypothetical protein
MPKHTYFAETVGFFVAFRALGIEFLASECTNSIHGHPAREGDMARMAMAQGRRYNVSRTP